MANDRIEKQIELKAPVSRVWRALTDYREFGEWFLGEAGGAVCGGERGAGTDYASWLREHLQMTMIVQKIEPERYFSYTWHPYAIDPKVDYFEGDPTLVEFRLEKSAKGTLLVVTESGFDKIPSGRRLEAFRMNENGWAQQLKNIESHVAERP
jgi:uncharacterized protein YndB with AHSA1/START domain